MEVKAWTYDEFPEFTEPVEGAHIISTSSNEMGTEYIPDVEYINMNGTPLHLQILLPSCRNDKVDFMSEEKPFRRPCVVFVQGSAWMPQNVYAKVGMISKLAERGYVCAIVEYRHSGIAYFPAQADDALNAVRFLRKNAPKYGIDPDQMILAGDSSGGHTAMWAGMLHNDNTEQNRFPGISGEVKGIVDYYGSTSVMAPDSNPVTVNHCRPDSPEGRVMGGKDLLEDPSLARALSVECNIDENTKLAPVLMFHGTKDLVVNCTGSVTLYKRLKETGHPVDFYLIQGANHGGAEFWTDEVITIVDAFIKKCLEA